MYCSNSHVSFHCASRREPALRPSWAGSVRYGSALRKWGAAGGRVVSASSRRRRLSEKEESRRTDPGQAQSSKDVALVRRRDDLVRPSHVQPARVELVPAARGNETACQLLLDGVRLSGRRERRTRTASRPPFSNRARTASTRSTAQRLESGNEPSFASTGRA